MRPVSYSKIGLLAAAILWTAVPAAGSIPIKKNAADTIAPLVDEYYRTREEKPLWFAPTASGAPQQLLTLLSSAEVDGLPKGLFQLGSLVVAIREASGGNPGAVRRAERMLSEAFVTYAQEMQRDPQVGVIYVDAALKPTPSSPMNLLQAAAEASSLKAYLDQIGWMNPVYGQLRKAFRFPASVTSRDRHILSLNLQRARALPWGPKRYVLVNTANQRLYMIEDGQVVDEMKIIAGRADAQTPLMNAYIRFAVVNPYWNVPSDIAARLAPNVLELGHSYLKKQGYQVVSKMGSNPSVVDPASVDWNAVAAGKVAVQLRQLPGPTNSMGRVKFMFPNSQGVWLHDTPSSELFANAERLNSAGCVRLEDARRLGSWLFKRPLSLTTREREQQISLPAPVPVYITYLTAVPNGSSISFTGDGYGRDLPPT